MQSLKHILRRGVGHCKVDEDALPRKDHLGGGWGLRQGEVGEFHVTETHREKGYLCLVITDISRNWKRGPSYHPFGPKRQRSQTPDFEDQV